MTVVTLTGVENRFDRDELIVSKTDLKGRITYANHVFCRVSEYSEKDLLGRPHSLVRHPDMPRCVFKLLWQRIENRQEIFAYVINRAKSGNHYWVLAHVSPCIGVNDDLFAYHSSRRYPEPGAVAAVTELYKQLRTEEQRAANAKDGLVAGGALLDRILTDKGLTYDEFIFSV